MGVVQLPPFIWEAHFHALIVNSGFLANFGFSYFWMEGMKPPLHGWWGSPLLVGGSIPHQGGRLMLSFLLTWGYLPVSLPLFVLPCQPWPSSVSGCILLGFTICQHQQALTWFPLPHVHVPSKVCGHITLPKVFTHLLWTLQGCPQQKS